LKNIIKVAAKLFINTAFSVTKKSIIYVMLMQNSNSRWK